MIAVGDHYFGQVPELLIRASNPFGGGIGGTKEELCGVLSGGTLILGALRGRVSAQENDDALYTLVQKWRARFLQQQEATQCKVIFGRFPEVKKRCAPVVEEGTRLLVQLLEEG